nr:hypothetical protein [Pseudonocardia sp. ICBG601]
MRRGAAREAGIDAVRAKSLRLTAFALDLADTLLAEHGVQVASPRDPDRRGGHVTLRRSDFAEVNARLWERGGSRLPRPGRHPDRARAAVDVVRRGRGGHGRAGRGGRAMSTEDEHACVEDGVVRDFRENLSYGRYLDLDRILGAQHRSAGPSTTTSCCSSCSTRPPSCG